MKNKRINNILILDNIRIKLIFFLHSDFKHHILTIFNNNFNFSLANHSTLLKNCIDIVNECPSNKTLALEKICNLLKEKIDYYDWVGFYFMDENEKKLILRSFAGKPTEHEKIPIGRGICGQVAKISKSLIIADVSKEKNYISCDIEVKSEIVVPIFVNGLNIGQIDVDSKKLNAFDKYDENFLKQINELISKNLF